jgi:hypothetical protein
MCCVCVIHSRCELVMLNEAGGRSRRRVCTREAGGVCLFVEALCNCQQLAVFSCLQALRVADDRAST